MSARFDGASTQYLVNSSPYIVGYPFTVGMFINLEAVGSVARVIWSLSDAGAADHYLAIGMTTGEAVSLTARAGGTENILTTSISLSAGSWGYVIGRFISSTNRRLCVLFGSGSSSVDTTSIARAPTNLNTMTIGALVTSGGVSSPWDGMIAEYWLAEGDVYPDSSSTSPDVAFTRFIRDYGPLRQGIKSKIVEHHSFFASPLDRMETYYGRGVQTWANTNGVTTGPHPALQQTYNRISDMSRALII